MAELPPTPVNKILIELHALLAEYHTRMAEQAVLDIIADFHTTLANDLAQEAERLGHGAIEGLSEPVERFDKFSAINLACLGKAKAGEPVFILLQRDPVYRATVEFWATAREQAIAAGKLPDTPHEREHIAIARRYAAATLPDTTVN